LIPAVVVASLLLPSGAAGRTAVTINPVITGTLGASGWYVSNVNVSWTFDPAPDQTQGCDVVTISADGTTNLLCSAWWGQVHIDYPLAISVDKTAPVPHGVPSRQPDASGWYNKPVTIAFTGTDATSGLAGCTSTAYAGPDNGNAAVSGTCTDRAGNVGRATYGFSYDSTPPTLGSVSVKHGNRNVLLSWTASSDTKVIQVTRLRGSKGLAKIVFSGTGSAFRDKGLRPGAKYQYTVSAFDIAANASSEALAVTATGPLVNPVPGERVTSPPRLIWLPVKGATYYNVQLIHNGRILSAWPRRADLKLQRSWIYKGDRYRLRPGVYRWYVWPGFGRFALANYGRRLGGSAFVYAA
jgi:hypothetical protein